MCQRILSRAVLRIILTTAVFALVPAWSAAATRTVCLTAGECQHQTIQAALNIAGSGDVILIRAGETFAESLTLPDKGALADYITLRSDAADANLPGPNQRISPAYSGSLPIIRSPTYNVPAIRTARGAQKYRLMFLEFKHNVRGFNDVITLGVNTTAQQFYTDQPNDIIVDRVIVRGDPIQGQKRGISLNGRNLVVKNSHLDRMAGFGQDAMAIGGFNASGPLTIENNYLEGTGYSFILGGDDPQMHTFAQVATTPAPTTTTATLTNFRTGHTIATLRAGQLIAVLAAGGTIRHHTYVRSISGNAITFDAIATAPDSGTASDIRWGEIPNGITFRRNHLSKPIEWYSDSPMLSRPSASAQAAATGGTLAPGAYGYIVTAVNYDSYDGNDAFSQPSQEATTALSGTGRITVSWSAVPFATHYRVYGRAPGAPSHYWEVAAPATSYADTGAAGTPGTPPSSTRWTVKNLFEIKFGTNWQVDSNVMEYSWAQSSRGDIGYAVWLKSNTQGGNCEFCQTKNVVFERNIIRHVAGVFNILAQNTNFGPSGYSAPLENLTIRDNLIHDSNTDWIDEGMATTYAIKVEGGVKNLVIDRNTFIHHMRGLLYLIKGGGKITDGLTFTNNIGRRESFGVFGESCTEGRDCLTKMTVGGVYTFAGNVIAGAAQASYPSGNSFPTIVEFQREPPDASRHFVLYDFGKNGDYSLMSTSGFNSAGTNGSRSGADVALVMTSTAGVVQGTGSSNTPPTAAAGGPYSGTPGQPVSLDGTGSTDTDGTIASYRWKVHDEVVIFASDFPDAAIHGRWAKIVDGATAGGARLENANLNDPKLNDPLASPVNYAEMTFNAAAGVPYHVWFRMKADADYFGNDSVFLQFSGSVDAAGNPAYRIGSTNAATVFLEEGTGAGLQGWGWNDNNYGALGPPIYFNNDGLQTLRIQQREDGVSIDQILLSADTYFDVSPGLFKNDLTYLSQDLDVLTGPFTSHSYRSAGIYPLVLTVTDNLGAQATATTTVTVGGSGAPTARVGGPYNGTAGQPVAFNGSASSDSDGTIAAYLWEFNDEVILYASDVADTNVHGRWQKVTDASAAGGLRLENLDMGDPKPANASDNPANYVEVTFRAVSGVPYRIWMRMRAAADAFTNDSVYAQFSGSVDAAGTPIYRIGTTSGASVILEEGSGAGLQGWGWNDNHYGSLGAAIYFNDDGLQTIRIQQREDGVSFDQIVISANTLHDVRPGTTTNDATIVPKSLATATGALPSHTYRFVGTYPVRLTVTDNQSNQASDSTTVTVR